VDNFELTQELDGTAMLSLEELVESVIQWGEARGITENSDAKTQYLKLVEEVGELGGAIARGRRDDMLDACGDIIVVALMIMAIEDTSMEECLGKAWNEIKDRKGFLRPDGIFIKEEDM
jgi:NTP pyrophosphatase (non-canonical NTP hydrolase)